MGLLLGLGYSLSRGQSVHVLLIIYLILYIVYIMSLYIMCPIYSYPDNISIQIYIYKSIYMQGATYSRYTTIQSLPHFKMFTSLEGVR